MAPERTPQSSVITWTREPWRRALHFLGTVAAWIVFLWAWYEIFIRPLEEGAWITFLLVLLYGCVITLVNILWIRFNIQLYKTRQRRTRTPKFPFTRTQDIRGRSLVAPPWADLQSARIVSIGLRDRDAKKVYEIVRGPAGARND